MVSSLLFHRMRKLMPARYIVSSIICSFGGFLMGCADQSLLPHRPPQFQLTRTPNSLDTSIIGPVTAMSTFQSSFGHLSPAILGILVSSILLSAAVGSLVAGRPADILGRPRAIALGASIFTIGVALQASAVHLGMFAVGRVIEGFGYGFYIGTQTVYICEIAPPKHRGALTSGPQFMTCLALVVGYFMSYGTATIPGSLSWRLPFIVTAVIAAMYVAANLFILPDSPPWLITQGRQNDADKAWDALGVRRGDREV